MENISKINWSSYPTSLPSEFDFCVSLFNSGVIDVCVFHTIPSSGTSSDSEITFL